MCSTCHLEVATLLLAKRWTAKWDMWLSSGILGSMRQEDCHKFEVVLDFVSFGQAWLTEAFVTKQTNTKQKWTCKLSETHGKGKRGFVWVRTQKVIWNAVSRLHYQGTRCSRLIHSLQVQSCEIAGGCVGTHPWECHITSWNAPLDAQWRTCDFSHLTWDACPHGWKLNFRFWGAQSF